MRSTFVTVMMCCLLVPSVAEAFVCLRTSSGNCLHWSANRTTVRTFLGSAGAVLLNGTTTWDQNLVSAADEWNSAGAAFRFDVAFGGQLFDPCTCPSSGPAGDNPVLFATSGCSVGFGDIVAETQSCFDRQSGAIISSGVFVNSRVSWNAYDGPLRPPVNDIRRVLVHELGHVLGLAHPDDFGQSVVAIMNSRESNIDRLTGDDVAGIVSIYGGAGGGVISDGNTCSILPHPRPGWLPWTSVALAALVLTRRRHRQRDRIAEEG
jgi:hypothetical protein